jgi:hypothetical protein
MLNVLVLGHSFKAEIHLENAEIHLNIVQMNLQWIENDEINLKKLKKTF